MKRCFAAVMFFVFVFSCSDSTGPGDDGGTGGMVVAEATIDAQGGNIGDDTIDLAIPAGAFGGEKHLVVSTVADEPFDTAISDTYVIDGLPVSFSADLTITIAATGAAGDSTYLAMGVESWTYGIGGLDTAWLYFPAAVTDSTVTATIPATTVMIGKPAATQSDQTVSAKVTVLSNVGTYVTPAGHFRITYDPLPYFSTPDDIVHLGSCLEEAYTTFQNMGFSYSRRTSWPIQVHVRSGNTTIDGKYNASFCGYNGGTIEINLLKLHNHESMKVTAGHEFFHLVQGLYDSRIVLARAATAPNLWLEEACAVWCEHKFSDEDNFRSEAFKNLEMAPFDGVVGGIPVNENDHGYGLAPMIEYLVDRFGEQLIVDTFTRIYNGEDGLTALINASGDPLEWWAPFIRSYFEGGIYDVDISVFLKSHKGLFEIDAADDTLKTFTGNYPDLSARLYKVYLNYNKFDTGDCLGIELDGSLCEFDVYTQSGPSDKPVFLGSSDSSFNVDNLKNISAVNKWILVVVKHLRYVEPYTSKTPLTLTLRVKKQAAITISNLNYALVSISDIIGTFSGSGTPVTGLYFSAYGSATSPTTFEASKQTSPAGYSVKTDLAITIDPLRSVASLFEAYTTIRDPSGAITEYNAIEGYDIPVTANWTAGGTSLDYVRFEITGPQVKSNVTNLIYKKGSFELTDFNADANTHITVEIKHMN